MVRGYLVKLGGVLLASLALAACEQARTELEDLRDSVRVPAPEEVSGAVGTLVEDTRANLQRRSGMATPDTAGLSAVAETTPDLAGAARPSRLTGGRASVFPQTLKLCAMSEISNAPRSRDGTVTAYTPLVQAGPDLALAVAPVAEACLSSGFGPRGDRLHKGIDLHHNQETAIFAAASGAIKQIKYRDDYGNMIVIDHGDGVYSRYAHLAGFAPGLTPGTPVQMGQTIGQMGNTAAYRIPVHLHYEVLEGDWDSQAGSFGLNPVDLFDLPPAN